MFTGLLFPLFEFMAPIRAENKAVGVDDQGNIVKFVLAIEVGGKNIDVYQSTDIYQAAEYAGYCYLIIGLVVGVSNLACGLCVGVLGSSTVLLHAQTPTGFVSMLVVMIFGSVFGLFGLIIGIIFQTNARWPTQ